MPSYHKYDYINYQWIEDAEEKWESQRKKVIETDDKSAKVEGIEDTSFDPKLELIVDEIREEDIPLLPKKALHVYDVYLQKGNVKVQPDGSIKVYLPYEEKEAPIVYQIDESGKIHEIKAEKEGSYVTFISDELGKYAISNTAQEENKDQMCVVGPDGVAGSGDEVCGKPNDKGDQPQKQPDGSVKVPEGGKVEFPNGTEIETPDGAIIKPDGTVVLPDGTEYDPDGNKKHPHTCATSGTKINIDTDGDGYPDLNIDLDGDCVADLSIDMDGDQIPDLNIDTDGDGKADINVDSDDDGVADVNILLNLKEVWKLNVTFVVNDVAYNSMKNLKPDLNEDRDGDGLPDHNIDTDGDSLPDKNVDADWWEKHGYDKNQGSSTNMGGAITGDTNKWSVWMILVVINTAVMIFSIYRKRHQKA